MVFFYHFSTLLKQLTAYNGRDPIFDADVFELIDARVFFILQDPPDAVFVKFSAAGGAIPLLVESLVDVFGTLPGGILLEDPPDDRSGGRIYLKTTVGAFSISQDSLPERFELQGAVIISALDVLAQVFGVVLSISLHDTLEDDPLGSLRDGLHGIDQADAALF